MTQPYEGVYGLPFHDNKSLFSDYYLQERLTDHPQWSEDISEAFESARQLYQEKRGILDGLNEAQTEEEFIKPLLRDILGFEFEVQESVTRHGRLNRPDYSLFPDSQTKVEAQRLREQEAAYYTRVMAVADAKYWGRPLDRKITDPRDELTNTNPSFQIVNYLVATGVDWGILTNGQQWRLYYNQARSRVDTYFEVDLSRILEEDNLEAFRYFYLFFRAAALKKDPQTDQSFLEAVYEGSVTYGAEIEKRLKNLIFEEIFIHLARGFREYRQTNGDVGVETEESLNEIYQGALRLLYRLLFLLHAEARALLPIHDQHGYRRYSLTRIAQDVADRLDRGETLSSVSTDIWNDLDGLFRIIDRGDPGLNVPRYNGGLFRHDNPRNAFLNTHRMADAYLAPALDLLTREYDPETGQRRFIDYKTLSVEQLGSIYEGLLEFHLRIAEQDLAVATSRGAEVYKPVEEVENPLSVIETGELYLQNDKGERKATGSYYTPHYIVEYIVEHTLGPVVDGRVNRFRELMEEIQSQREVEQQEKEAVEALLGIRVCDPAMGSGHFLVYAADWLAERLIAVLNEFPENPVLHQIAEIRQQIIDELMQQDISIDAGKLKDTNLLKRMVMKRCIYGVDLNPMATELAKLSLWLDSFTIGAPLSFLNHHLKVGNSLIGTTVGKVQEALQDVEVGDLEYQMQMFGGPFAGLLTATSLMRDVAAYTDATLEEVEQSAKKYEAFEEAILPYKRVLNLWVSQHFGNVRARELVSLYGEDALQAVTGDEVELSPEYQEAVNNAYALWQDKRFFHWELEFPEVFIDLEKSDWKQNQGFDAVVGNPPYGMTTESHTKEFAKSHYETSEGRDDKYKLFTEQAYRLARNGGLLSYITSSTMLTNRFDAKLRHLLLVRGTWRQLATFGYPVFDDPTVHSAVFVIQKQTPESGQHFFTLAGIDHPDELQETGRRTRQSAFLEDEFYLIAVIEDDKAAQVVEKLNAQGQPLGELAHIRQCIKTGDDNKYLKKSSAPLDDPWKPVLGGSNVTRYHINWPQKYLKYGSWLARNWQNPDFFERPKIVVRETSKRITASLDRQQFYLLSTLYSVYFKGDFSGGEGLEYLLATLNSKIAQFFMHHLVFALSSGAFVKARANHYARLPFRRIQFTTPTDIRADLVAEGQHLYQSHLTNNDQNGVLDFTADQLTQDPERADVVHDLLSYLVEQIIEMHEQKRKEVEGFLWWLEREMGTALDNLSGYTIIQEYYALDGGLNELLDRLGSNNSKIPKLDMRSRSGQERVVKEYEASMDALRPLLTRIERTDQLIDQIVYHLYGLTEEEIAVIEDAD